MADNKAQIRANKRYEERNPEAKLRNNIARAKSTCKRYIREYATLEDLEEIKEYIRKVEGSKMTIEEKIKKLIKENGEAYLLRSCTLQIAHKKKPLNQYDWDRIEDNLDYTIEGVYATKEEAERQLEPWWKKFTNSGWRFVDFHTGEVAWIVEDNLKQAEEDGVTIEEFLNSGDISFEDGYLGMEEFKEFLKDWIG